MQSNRQHYIDKTDILEKEIVGFPSIYIMGAAATGKSTAVKMLLKKHPEVSAYTMDLARERVEHEAETETFSEAEFGTYLSKVRAQMEEKTCWIILENVPARSVHDRPIAEFVECLPVNGRVILVGRENLPEELLPLLWERKLEIIPQEALAFSIEEVRELGAMTGSALSAEEVWACTGGWAGCVDMMFRMSVSYGLYRCEHISVEELRKSYEIRVYIQKCIESTLSDTEWSVLDYSRACPWMDERLCTEMLHISDAGQVLTNMTRKGYLVLNRKEQRWRTAPLFRMFCPENSVDSYTLGQWYDRHGYVREAFMCYEKTNNLSVYSECIFKYYDQIPGIDALILKSEWEGDGPEFAYLRGVRCYTKHDFAGVDSEILKLQKMEVADEFHKKEILLNLYYLKPELSLADWLVMLENDAKLVEETGRKFRLYRMLGKSGTYLCGIRDLTSLFACSKKEENRKAKIWKNLLGEREWKSFCLARMEYYLETERKDSICEEDWEVFREGELDELANLCLLGKLQRIFQDDNYGDYYKEKCYDILQREEVGNVKVAKAFINLHSSWIDEPERLTRWLKHSEKDEKAEVDEENYCILWCISKGYLLLDQYKKAEKILDRLIPYLKMYRRTKLLAEALLQKAIIGRETGRNNQALQNIIESFYVSGESRYVGFYVSYGRQAQKVIEAYDEWNRASAPEAWSRKKKYQYGNVLRMPVEDYIGVILRLVRREARTSHLFQLHQEEMISERLTMMETIILQDIGRGLSNSEICLEQNLKLPTVKTHIYSLYKKLGVNSRVQAIIKGKEMGILE